MKRSPQSNGELTHAFPAAIREDALTAFSSLPQNPYAWTSFTVLLDKEEISIPDRVYHNAALINTGALSARQKQLLHCVLTRHHDGFVRQASLREIIASGDPWIPSFVIQLAGKYVIEILNVINESLGILDASVYSRFLSANSDFLRKTQQRVTSYWNCYYRSIPANQYVGFRVLDFFTRLLQGKVE